MTFQQSQCIDKCVHIQTINKIGSTAHVPCLKRNITAMHKVNLSIVLPLPKQSHATKIGSTAYVPCLIRNITAMDGVHLSGFLPLPKQSHAKD